MNGERYPEVNWQVLTSGKEEGIVSKSSTEDAWGSKLIAVGSAGFEPPNLETREMFSDLEEGLNEQEVVLCVPSGARWKCKHFVRK
jgi:hypothetical protein